MNNIQILLGAEGIKQVYEMSLKTDRLDIVCLSENYSKIIGNYFDEDYSPRLFNSQILTREIVPNTQENREYSRKKNGVKNQVRFFNGDKSESDMMLFEGKVVLLSYNSENPYAILIQDSELFVSLKSQFEALWKFL